MQRSTPSLSQSEVELTGENSVEFLPNPAGLSDSDSAAIGATPPLTASQSWSFSFRRIGSLYKVTGWLRVAFNRSPGLPVNTLIRGELTHSLVGATYRIRSASEKAFIFTVPGFSSACPVPANRQDAFRVVDLTRSRVVIRVPVTWSTGSRC